jgi:hypothetical protein
MSSMNWHVVHPELWLLLAACVVLLVDIFNNDPERRPTFWLTQASIAIFVFLQLQDHGDGITAYGMQGMVVVDPMGRLLAALAGLSVMVTLAYARPTLASRDMLKGEFFTLALFMLLGISPEMTTAAYRMGDSIFNIVTPLASNVPLVLIISQRWKPDFGIGSMIALMLPYSLAFGLAGIALVTLWVSLSLPVGPGAPATYSLPPPAIAAPAIP